tara:strand:+ start:337 stop:486 length:150 start_codon:yes stop_codon:yes gene_type:complete
MSSTEIIQLILSQFNGLSRAEKMELIEILMQHLENELKKEHLIGEMPAK